MSSSSAYPEDESFERKLQPAWAELDASPIWAANSDAPLLRLLRRRWNVPPPHYCSFRFNFLFNAIWFGPPWAMLMWLWTWSAEGMPVLGAVAGAMVAGIVFGLCMAIYYRASARKHGLSSWDSL